MKKIKRLLITGCVLISLPHFLKAQDPSFSNFHFNDIYFNPAFCGRSEKDIRFGLASRASYMNVISTFITSDVYFDCKIEPQSGLYKNKDKSYGIGLIAFHDIEGECLLQTYTFGVPFAFHLVKGKTNFLKNKTKKSGYWSLDVGGQISLLNKYINWDKLTFSSQYDPIDGLVNSGNAEYYDENYESVFQPDLAGGFIIKYVTPKNTKVELGFSHYHILEPKISFYEGGKLPRKMVYHIAIEKKPFSSALILEKQSDMLTILGGANIKAGRLPLTFGMWYRDKWTNLGTLILNTEIKFDNNIECYYLYEFPLSSLYKSVGSQEIGIRFVFNNESLFGNKIEAIKCSLNTLFSKRARRRKRNKESDLIFF